MESLRDAYIYNFIAMCRQFAESGDMVAAGEYLDRLDRQSELEFEKEQS